MSELSRSSLIDYSTLISPGEIPLSSQLRINSPQFKIIAPEVPQSLWHREIKQSDFKYGENGIDVNLPTTVSNQKYQNRCFLELMQRFPALFCVGPNIVDYAFGPSPCGSMSRPDSLLFAAGKRGWVVVGMAETLSKGITVSKVEDKTKGFASLMDRLRSDKNMLTESLNRVTGEVFIFPNKIYIPPNIDIRVSFWAPHFKERPTKEALTGSLYAFPVLYEKVPKAN